MGIRHPVVGSVGMVLEEPEETAAAVAALLVTIRQIMEQEARDTMEVRHHLRSRGRLVVEEELEPLEQMDPGPLLEVEGTGSEAR